MKRWFLISAAAMVLSAGASQADFTLHVLHINDFHSGIEPISKFDSTCDAKDAARKNVSVAWRDWPARSVDCAMD